MSADAPPEGIDALPDSARVLDVGGWAAPHPRADWVLDFLPYETRNWFYRERDERPPDGRVTADRWVQMDACERPWPFEDSFFDYVLCSHTLEDVRDPVGVCKEMARVGRAGAISAPGAIVDLTRGVESPLWCGWRHHRWLLEPDGDGIVFVGKPHHIHSPAWPSVRTPKLWRPGADVFELQWRDGFAAREQIFVEGAELDAWLQRIVARDANDDPVGAAARRTRAAGLRAYAGVRAAAGRLVRHARR